MPYPGFEPRNSGTPDRRRNNRLRHRRSAHNFIDGNTGSMVVGAESATDVEDVDYRLDCSPPTKANRAQSPACSLLIFASGTHTGQFLWSAGYLEDIPFPPPLHSSTAPYSPHFTLIGSQDLDVKSRRITDISTSSFASHQGKPGSISGEVAPRFSHVGIVPDRDLTFPPPLHSGAAQYSPLKTTINAAAFLFLFERRRRRRLQPASGEFGSIRNDPLASLSSRRLAGTCDKENGACGTTRADCFIDFGQPWKTGMWMAGRGTEPTSTRMRGQWLTTAPPRLVMGSLKVLLHPKRSRKAILLRLPSTPCALLVDCSQCSGRVRLVLYWLLRAAKYSFLSVRPKVTGECRSDVSLASDAIFLACAVVARGREDSGQRKQHTNGWSLLVPGRRSRVICDAHVVMVDAVRDAAKAAIALLASWMWYWWTQSPVRYHINAVAEGRSSCNPATANLGTLFASPSCVLVVGLQSDLASSLSRRYIVASEVQTSPCF
ncbi:hypothetical protein PR048_002423 [Dryococelus australis]|uniref:Uncharacterized protein n=1 Tax=Dryococelus australis TaxID=614101 RepID=A0ABQ9IK58_9NEOP|nr:hypothetical protein PR048_002423 [Dryococelus australis]